jgi:hypothetical protein
VPAAQTEQVALTPSGPVYPSEQTLQTVEPALAVLLVGQLHESARRGGDRDGAVAVREWTGRTHTDVANRAVRRLTLGRSTQPVRRP